MKKKQRKMFVVTEHMIFMGNSKYKIENAWDKFLNKHNGYTNAMTETIHTTYGAEIPALNSNIFIEMLDRFAHNFISPLFKLDSTERELNAIESEFQQILLEDYTRKRSVTCRQCNPKHPIFQFG